MKVHFVSLGCPKNVTDLEKMLGALGEELQVVTDPGEADVSIVNTCAFIDSAKEEAIDSIFEIVQVKQSNPKLKILVTGCLPQRYGKPLTKEFWEVDAFFEGRDAVKTARQIRRFLGYKRDDTITRTQLTPQHYAYLKISEGCNNRCSYCAIPGIKGRFKSRPFFEILNEAAQMTRAGIREIIVVAQDTTFYGQDLNSQYRLPDLLYALNELPHLRWIRLMYTHPAHFTRELISTIANLPKVVKYIDLPIQHISDRILAAMGRKVTRLQVERLIHQIRSAIPDVALRTSLIVGFPGETRKEFRELCEFVETTRFARLGVFTYSREEGTRAFHWKDSVAKKTKNQRQLEILERQSQISYDHNQKLIGEELLILVDSFNERKGFCIGRTQWDAPEIDNSVILHGRAQGGEFCKTTIQSADAFELFALPAIGIN